MATGLFRTVDGSPFWPDCHGSKKPISPCPSEAFASILASPRHFRLGSTLRNAVPVEGVDLDVIQRPLVPHHGRATARHGAAV